MRPSVVAAFVTAVFAFGPSPKSRTSSALPTVVILVRHAEKAAQPAQDPPLTEGGAARAEALAAIAREAQVSAIITTQFLRTRKTAEPSATLLNITPEVVAASGPNHVKDVAAQVRTHAGGTVLVVGHSNTIPAIVAELGGPRLPDICDSQYDQLFVVIVGDTGPPRLVRSRYGAPSPADAACATMR